MIGMLKENKRKQKEKRRTQKNTSYKANIYILQDFQCMLACKTDVKPNMMMMMMILNDLII